MKIFLDANVLVSVLNHEYPVYHFSSRVLSLADNPKFKVYTSPLCLAIAYYFAEKKSGSKAREKISLLASRLHISQVSERNVREVCLNKRIHDFEDGLQYYSALESGCKLIVTEDGDDFYFSEIEVLNSRQFLENYAI